MNTRKFTFLSVILSFFMIACGPGKSTSEESAEAKTEPAPKITLTDDVPASPAYENAKLNLGSMDITKSDDGFNAKFDFEVSDYELGVQTEGATTRGIANSGKGQHIHFIVNNGPYSAHYAPSFEKPMEEGNYVLLAFLSRSYHESVKNPDAFWVDAVTVGEPEETLEVDFSAQHMFYSRPKGTYSGADTKKVMLDFYLLNTEISADGNKVRATINGEEFLITEWKPMYINNAPLGELKVKLELIDAAGNLIPGPFNSVERTVTLAE
ncbi:MAG: hypothetical protein R8G66_05150 [Cytophagales bacterium]|nr:hypothetical protein [Cytophagales bacterium]